MLHVIYYNNIVNHYKQNQKLKITHTIKKIIRNKKKSLRVDKELFIYLFLPKIQFCFDQVSHQFFF